MTVAELISKALRLVGVLASGETAQIEEMNDGLAALNQMLESWRLDRLMTYAILRSAYTLTAGLNPHTIGTGGSFNGTRPVAIERAGIIEGDTEHPLEVIRDAASYAAISDKLISGTPQRLYYRPSFPLGSIYLWPVPANVQSIALYVWDPITGFTTLFETVAFPPGYTRAIHYNLAVDLAPEFGRQVDPVVAAIATESKAAIMSINAPAPELTCDPAVVLSASQVWDHRIG